MSEATDEIQYATSGDGTHIAYQTLGSGAVDLLYIPPATSHLELRWDDPAYASVQRRLASFSRFINLDKRGSGLSDRTVDLPTHEQQIEDIVAVLDAVGSTRTYLFGALDGAISSLLTAAAHPGRVAGVVTYAGFARAVRADDYPIGFAQDTLEQILDSRDLLHPAATIPIVAPSMVGDAEFERWWARYMRSATPAALANWQRSLFATDIRDILPSVRLPVLVLHLTGDRAVPIEWGRWLAEHLPDGRLVELPGDDHLFWVGDRDALVDAIEVFVTGDHAPVVTDRMLATVLFIDIVGSTKRAAELGDDRWRQLLEDHDATVANEVARHRGTLVKSTGDGALATFDGPARAVTCAVAVRDRLRRLGIEIRAGLHTGEIERRGDDVGGIGVHLASRIQRLGDPGAVLVSRTVVDLVVGSGLDFADRGSHELRGVPGEWQLFEVVK